MACDASRDSKGVATVLETAIHPGAILLGKYRVERALGRGGMGLVVAARHIELRELFAIKLLAPSREDHPTAVSRFLREARAAARLTSEHAARVYDVGRLDDGTPFLVMEYLDGDNLDALLRRRGALPLGEAVRLVLEACDAIAEAHAIGIVHRDLKPSNLFLARRHNGRPCLKVIDFGVSKQSGESERLTQTGAIVGSPHCMSPEQIRAPQTVDGRSDIWALGVILYLLTTGQEPFRGGSLPGVIHSVLNTQPVPPSQLRPELPPAFDEVVARCLRKRLEERYATIEEFAAAVRSLAGLVDETPPIAMPEALPSSRISDVVEPILPASSETPSTLITELRVFISCRSDVAEDRQVATAFHEALAAAGASPFFAPRDVAGHEDWTRVVSQALRSCDAFLLLLSPHAAVSEMVAAEFDMARQLAARSGGRPCILPVYVHPPDDQAQGHPLQERLQDLEHAFWNDVSDTPLIVKTLLERIGRRGVVLPAQTQPKPTVAARRPAPAAPAKTQLELPGGIVSARSPCYVARPSLEEACLREVVKPGALIRIRGPRQMGKTSLMMGIMEHAAQLGARTVTINLQLADAAILADQARFLRWLCAVVTRRLKLPVQRIDELWDHIFGAKDNCSAYFEEHLLPGAGPLVLALDHVDRLFESPATAEEILALLRAWHEMGKSQSPWHDLRLVLVYSTEMYVPLNINRSPFNVGLPAVLAEWDADMVQDLAQRHGLTLGRADIDQLMGLLGGHPHLVRIALYHLAGGMSLADLMKTAATDEGLFADHLKHLLWQLQSQPELCEAARHVMAATEPVRLSTELSFKLVSLGLVRLQGNEVIPGRDLYRRYLAMRLPARG
ncbi:MAG TPA: AAA-like domain-containing protein [Polyangia bacterium]|nr:AAA-like domain-containing protein [Polyangia bacterium]